jgi:hypothetical protein
MKTKKEKNITQKLINIQIDTFNNLSDIRDELTHPIYGKPSYTQVIQYILKTYNEYKNK